MIPRRTESPDLMPWPAWLTRWVLAVVATGVAWRTVRYFQAMPIWGDEAFVCLNFLDRGYVQLLRPLRFGQVAPVLFLWAERSAYALLGGGELALRLVPYLAGVAALGLFWKLARLSLAPAAAALAVGILAVSYYPVRHACEAKPYAGDLFLALALWVPAASWLQSPGQVRWLAVLAVAVPVVLCGSYPAVFVAGSVSVVLLPAVWRSSDRRVRVLYVVYNVLMVAGFAAAYRLVGRGQFDSTGGEHNQFWEMWFPPARPLALARWLVDVHTGNLLAYPVGGHDGGSTVTCLLVILGAWAVWRQGRKSVLGLCLIPFGLTFVAAAMQRYPYGGSARVAQHLAPGACLLAGAGAWSVVGAVVRSEEARRRALAAGCAGLVLLGVVGLSRDVLRPYKTDGDRQARRIVSDVFHRASADDQIIVVDPTGSMGPTFEWYLRQHAGRVRWDGRPDPRRLDRTGGEVWCLRFGEVPAGGPDEPAWAHAGRPFALREQATYVLQMGWSDGPVERCQVTRWARRS